MRMRKKKNLLPRMERCGAYQIKDPYERKGRWHDLMPEAKEIRVELGCGKGRFTVETAAAEPDVLLIAVEKVPDAMVVAMERAAKAELHNVFFIDIDANQLPEIFDAGEVDRIYVNFCDPWPPKRQAKRRLTHGNFLKLYRKVLKDNGQIHFKTDNDPLFEWSIEEIPQFGFDPLRGHARSARERTARRDDRLRGQILCRGQEHQPLRRHDAAVGRARGRGYARRGGRNG